MNENDIPSYCASNKNVLQAVFFIMILLFDMHVIPLAACVDDILVLVALLVWCVCGCVFVRRTIIKRKRDKEKGKEREVKI